LLARKMDVACRLRWSRRASPGEESRFRPAGRHSGSFDDLTVRAAGRRAGLGARSVLKPLRVFGRRACPTRVPALDSSRPLALHCRSLVGSRRPVERELDSQPGNRCSAARGLRWPAQALNTPACGVPCRSRVCSTFTSVAEVGVRFSIHRSRSTTEGALDRANAGPFMWSGGKRSARGVRRESVFLERRSKRPAHLASPDDRKRVEAT
jgi:hypothetical protein